ncbi:MAG: DUF5916 domain-containing protein [Bacteroidota bacterium]
MLVWLLLELYPAHQNDFYEPRKEGWFFRRGASVLGGAWFESNASKQYSMYTEVAARKYINFYDLFAMDALLNQNYRFNNRFSLSHRIRVLMVLVMPGRIIRR